MSSPNRPSSAICSQSSNKACPSVRSRSLKRENHKKLSSLHSTQSLATFELKCSKELDKLRSNCCTVLKQNLESLFEEQSFADIIIESDSFRKHCHICLLITRVPVFYNNLLNFRVKNSKSHSNSGIAHYKLPGSVQSEVQIFLRKVYCSESIEQEEIVICSKLRALMSQEEHQDSGDNLDQKSDGINSPPMKEDSLEEMKKISGQKKDDKTFLDVKDSDAKEVSSQDSLKPSDSLELVTDSLNNGSLSSGDNKNQESDFDDSLTTPNREENAPGLTSSGSSQMVRSGTFDLLSSIPPDQTNFDRPIESKKQSDSTTRPQIESNESKEDCRKKRTSKNWGHTPSDDVDTLKDNDITPVADASLSNSPFQFFIDIERDSGPKVKDQVKKVNSTSKSGLIFIDFNSIDEKNTPEKDKKKLRTSRSNRDSSQSIETHSRNRNTPKYSTLSSSHKENVPDSQSIQSDSLQLFHSRQRSGACTKDKIGPSKTPKSHKFHHKNHDSGSPLSSLDSGMLSSLNSEGAQADDEEWLIKAEPTRSQPVSRSLFSHGYSHGYTAECSPNNYQKSSECDPNSLTKTLMSCSRLGEDLLQMFLTGVYADVTICTNGADIKAHKCILVSRCPYFAAMYKGDWADSKSFCISLRDFGFENVHFALSHVYSGSLLIPEGLDLGELALISNLLALDTLRDVVIHEMEKTYCHFFHKPCSECIEGVVDCLVVSSECSFMHLNQKCTSWIGKHFLRVWPTRSFASLPTSLLNSCFRNTIAQFSPETIIETLLSCEKLAKTTPKVKWAEPIFRLIDKLVHESCDFISAKYDSVISTNSFLSLGRSKSWDISAIEGTFLSALTGLTPDTGCKALLKLDTILNSAENETAFGYGPYAENYVTLVRKMSRQCERFLVQNVNTAIRASSWSQLPVEIQQRIKDSAVIVFEFDKPLAPRPQLTSSQLHLHRRKKELLSNHSSRSSSHEDCRSLRRVKQIRSRDSSLTADDGHIYDELTSESTLTSQEMLSLDENSLRNRNRVRHRTGERKSSQVAKVPPFSCRLSAKDSSSTEQLVSEIDLESRAVNSRLQEAQILEKELSRKLQKHKSREKVAPPGSPGHLSSSSSKSSSSRPKTSSSIKPRPPFK
ncbi:uncharacterized protein LOC141856287 [Brevipalpus obovatus]|uniref:uncharacterized protein LOC141856287 n=1 Tax=Brevipalpus obovatus TaxID=246614 RepID=UPI003D9F0C26